MKPQLYLSLLVLFFTLGCSSDDTNENEEPETDTLYFPPINSDTWETTTVSELGWNTSEIQPLLNYVESKGMIFISTPFSRAAVERLERMNVSAYKIGSGECNNYPLLEHIAQFGKPIILSTGMNTIESVSKAVAIFDRYKVPLALLHTTNYIQRLQNWYVLGQ